MANFYANSYAPAQKVYIRPFKIEDITPIYIGWLNNKEIVKFSNQRFQSHTRESCINYLKSFRNTSNEFFLINEKGSHLPLGTLTIYKNLHHGTADIGILIGEQKKWGQGIGFDAFSIALEILAKDQQIRKITAGTVSTNLGMIRILKKANFYLEATRKDHEVNNNQLVDVLYFAKFTKNKIN